MNNRYICKGKRKDNGEWVEGYLIQGNKTYIATIEATNYMVVSVSCMASIELAEVIPETVRQCTTLTDKNSKLIFEGDIVNDKESGLFGKVIFATAENGFDGLVGFMVDDVDDGLQNYNGFWHLVKVIGNELDNPELLEVEK